MNEPQKIECSTQPLTAELLQEYADRLFRQLRAPKQGGPSVDVMKLVENGIPFHMERPDLVLVSSEGYKKAKACGAITP